MHCRVWNAPALPVMPCTTRRVSLSTRIDIYISGKQESRNAGTMENNLLLSLAILLFRRSFCLSFVNQKFVAVWIADLRHPANRRLGFFHVKGDAAFVELNDCRIEVVHFESDC